MESNDKLKEVDIKNHWCYYFDDTIRIEGFYFNKILLGEISLGIFWFRTFHKKR